VRTNTTERASPFADRRIAGAAYQRPLADGAIYVAGLGRYYKDEEKPDWTSSNLVSPEDAEKNSPLTRHLPVIAQELGLTTFVMPSPGERFTARILPRERLLDRIELRCGVIVRRNVHEKADGLLLAPGEIFALSLGGCAMIVGWRIDRNTGKIAAVGVSHAGLVSILNDVGGNLLAALGNDPAYTYFSIEFAVSPRSFVYSPNDPKWGSVNKVLHSYIGEWWKNTAIPREHEGGISTTEMLRVQLQGLKVPDNHISVGIETGLDGRFYTTSDKQDSRLRNLGLVAYFGQE
jgi:hypothetical protein